MQVPRKVALDFGDLVFKQLVVVHQFTIMKPFVVAAPVWGNGVFVEADGQVDQTCWEGMLGSCTYPGIR